MSKDILQEYNQMPENEKAVQVVEAYTTKDSAYYYTLILVANKVRESSIKKFLDFMTNTHNIVQNNITGYETADGVAETSEEGDVVLNPLLKMILQHYTGNHPNVLDPFVDDGGVRPRGMFQFLTARYPSIKNFIASLSASGSSDELDTTNNPKKQPVQENTQDIQHDGSSDGSILGKQKMAERAESPTSAAGEPKRQRGSVLAMLHAELGILVVREEEIEKLKLKDASNAEEIQKLKEKDAGNAEQTQKLEETIDMLETKIDNLENKLANVNDTLPAKINELSADKTALQSKVIALETSVGDISTANNALQVKYNDLGTTFLEISTEKDDLQTNNYTLQAKVGTAEMAVVKITAEKDELKTKYSLLEKKIYDRERKISDMELKLTAQNQETKRVHDLMRGIFNELPIRTVGFSNHPDDPGADVVLISEPTFQRNAWVFRFKIGNGEKTMSTDALASMFAEDAAKNYKLVSAKICTIGDCMYVFVKLSKKSCNASWLMTEIVRCFTVSHLELISPTSRDAVLFHADHSPKKWTEEMFNLLVSRMHQSFVATRS